MSSGSWLNEGQAAGDAIGTTPGGFGPEEKLFLHWLDYSEVNAGETGDYLLGPSQTTFEGKDQAVKVNLPNSQRTDNYVTPPEGTKAWWSGRGDDLKNTLARTVPAGSSVTVSADLWYDIEENFDFLYAEYSTDGGSTWTQAGAPLTGSAPKWAAKKWTYKPAGGAQSQFRFRYATDGGFNLAGAFIDNIGIKVGKTYSFTDGAESGANGWVVDGWKASTGSEVTNAPRYYLLENRQYVGYDHTLEVGPYQFSEAVTRPDWVERFPYQTGLLVWMVDQGFADNNTITHEGAGYALPVDARPNTLNYSDGTSPTNRREPFDAVFGTHAARRRVPAQAGRGQGQGQDDRAEPAGLQRGRLAGAGRHVRRHEPARLLLERQPAELREGRGRGGQGHGDERGRQRHHRPRGQPRAALTG